MDADVSALVSAVPAGHPRAEELFHALREAWEAERTDLGAFLDRVRADAGHLLEHDELDVLRDRLDQLGGDPVDHLGRLAEHDPADLAAHHAQLTAPGHSAPGEHAPGEHASACLDWVRQDQAERLQRAWGPDWPSALPEHLDRLWGGDWAVHPDEHKASRLDDALADLLGPSDTDRFGWVPDDQAERLRAAWGEPWRHYLAEQLDHRWGADWEAHPADHRAAWLPDLVDELLAPAEDIRTEDIRAEDIPAQAAPGRAAPAGVAAPGNRDAEIEAAVDAALAEVPGADSLSEEDLAAIRGLIAAELAGDRGRS